VIQDALMDTAQQTGNVTPATVPSVAQVKRLAQSNRRDEFFGHNAFLNVINEFTVESNPFCRVLNLAPKPYMIFATTNGLNLLADHGNHFFHMDGTFNVINLALELTTIMVRVGDISVPVVWVFMQNHTTEDYGRALRDIRYLTQNRWRPDWIICDFETAMRNAAAEGGGEMHSLHAPHAHNLLRCRS
jgi:hypothetical protein